MLPGQLDIFKDYGARMSGKQKLTDDARILVALRKGYAVNFHWHGEDRPRFSRDCIADGDRWRNVAHTACRRLHAAGLIVTNGWSRPGDFADWEAPYKLTERGVMAAADLADIPDAAMFATRKETPPDKLDAARHRRHVAKIAEALTFNAARLRNSHVMFAGGGTSLITPYASALRSKVPDAVMLMLAPHMEAFVDVDGKESLRITEAGIAATAKRGR
jgi:hypothetical protein